ncbi:MAG: ATP-binding cassette domain-containing protein [Candidatus Eisenbacteria bacterium]|nr:ATP-binding cassette domain-containing protein [Candidatus Eisenbacteria bacterium]
MAVELLRIEGLCVTAGQRTLLADFDLRLGAGEFVALRGRSGSGKTTLLRAISGLVDAPRGEVRLRGRSPAEIGWPAFRRQVALVEQRPVLFDASVRANLARPFRYRTAGAAAFSIETAAPLLERFGLRRPQLSQNARSLSQGEQQRVSLIRALLVEPPVLLLDEPTSALDEQSVAEVERALREAARGQGLAALIVTHDRQQADRLCDRTLELQSYAPRDAQTGAASTATVDSPRASEGDRQCLVDRE